MGHVTDPPLSDLPKDDLDIVLHTVQLHAPVTMPAGVICRNCSWPYPCPTRIACDHLLTDQTDARLL
jgi:hypothetical protein